MAVQKSRKTPSRRDMRRSHDALTGPTLSVDATTGVTHRRHHVTADGYLPRQEGVRSPAGQPSKSSRFGSRVAGELRPVAQAVTRVQVPRESQGHNCLGRHGRRPWARGRGSGGACDARADDSVSLDARGLARRARAKQSGRPAIATASRLGFKVGHAKSSSMDEPPADALRRKKDRRCESRSSS